MTTPRPRRSRVRRFAFGLSLVVGAVVVLLFVARFALFSVGSSGIRGVSGALAQNGFTLVARHTGSNPPPAPPLLRQPFAYLLYWIRIRNSPPVSPGNFVIPFPCLDFNSPSAGTFSGATELTATARAANGDIFPLAVNDPFLGAGFGGAPKHMLIHLPAAVPDGYLPLTVTVTSNRTKTSAVWIVSDLPPLEHTIPSAPAFVTTAAPVANIRVEGRAWWDAKTPPLTLGWDDSVVPLTVEMQGLVKEPKTTRQWQVQFTNLSPEWQEAAGQTYYASSNGYRESSSGYQGSDGEGYCEARAQNTSAPTPACQHWVKANAELLLHDSHEETVTFTQIPIRREGKGFCVDPPQPLTETTPSGITVTLLKADQPPYAEDLPGQVVYRARLSPGASTTRLPASPLFQRTGGKPVEIRLQPRWDSSAMHQMAGPSQEEKHPDTYIGGVTLAKTPKGTIPRLSFTVYQDSIVQRVPFTLMLPVRKGKPADDWTLF